MTRLARRLRRALALLVAASIVALSPGLEAPRLFAQVVVRTAPVEGIAPIGGAAGAAPAALSGPVAAPSLSPLSAAPSLLSAPAPTGQPSASAPAMAAALAAPLAAASRAGLSANEAAAAGRGIEDAITGARSAGSGDVAAAPAAEAAAASTLSGTVLAAASAPADPAKPSVPAAAAPAEGRSVESSIAYRVQRRLLQIVAALTGGVYSLPSAGPALTDKLIASAADKSVVLSDYDDTLSGYKTVLPADMVSAVQAIRAAGKDFAVISDRGDEPKPGELTVFQSLESIPAESRAGMYVAANSGGRVYRYDEKGEPVRLYEAPGLVGESKDKASEAVAAMKARLPGVGVEQHFPSAANTVPNESWNVYSYALMLKVGSSNAQVQAATAILQEELTNRGFDVQVNPRFAKDPTNPPYISFSVITKKTAAAYIVKALNAEAKDVLILGDSMYTPSAPKKESWLTRFGAKLTGRAMPPTGNRTDANMEKAVPGALTFSVGTSGDPRLSNLWVLAGKGPSVTRRALMSVASKRLKTGSKLHDVVVPLVFVAAVAAFYFFLIDQVASVIAGWEQTLHQNWSDAVKEGGLFGGILGWTGLKGKIPQSWKENAAKAVPVAAAIALLTAAAAGFYEMLHAFGQVLTSPEPGLPLPNGGDPLFGMTLGAAGAYGFGAAGRVLPGPAQSYAEARKAVVELAAGRGVAADKVLFVRATATMPAGDGAQWHYEFSIPGKDGSRTAVYADMKSILGVTPEVRTSTYENAPDAIGTAAALEPGIFSMGTKSVDPRAALDAARRAQPGMSAGVSVALDYREEPVSGDKDLWYRFFDDKGAVVSVNARTSQTRVEAAPPGKESLKASVSRVSPIDGFSTFVYAEALTAARAHAVELGYKPDNLRVTSALLSPRAWGEDWTFHFVAPRENILRDPMAFELKVRRTMVSETMVDAYDVKDLGRSPLFVGFKAADLPGFVKIDPMDIVAKSGDAARTLELEARWTGPHDEPELWYVVRGAKGRELEAFNARTGEKDTADPYHYVKAFLTFVASVGLLALIYGGIYYAFLHSPAAQDPNAVPIPSGTDFNALFGGTLGFFGAAGVLGAKKTAKTKVGDEEIEAAAKSVTAYKGGVWSQTEYNAGYYNTLDSLTKRGATKAQLERFRKLCDETPVIGGRFNPWSGD